MSPRTSGTGYSNEPRQRFYPTQGNTPTGQPLIPSAPTPASQKPSPVMLRRNSREHTPMQTLPNHTASYKKSGDATYLMHRHPVLLQRLYNTVDNLLETYPKQSFLYDAYPDYVSLRLLRDRLLRENLELTEEFLQSGCPVLWLELLTDTVLSEVLCRKRCFYRNPMGEASTTSVQSVSLS